MTRNCSTCVHFTESRSSVYGGQVGDCRRYPPVLIHTTAWACPVVSADFGCGEYSPIGSAELTNPPVPIGGAIAATLKLEFCSGVKAENILWNPAEFTRAARLVSGPQCPGDKFTQKQVQLAVETLRRVHGLPEDFLA